MLRLYLLIAVIVVQCSIPFKASAQADELAQLALNIEKLSQLKSVLQSMYDGYKILTDGYNKVKNVANGNYKLHQLFLDGLYLVNPEIRKYRRVGDIVTMQLQMMNDYKKAIRQFRLASLFNPQELDYFEAVYSGLFDRTLNNLEELTMIITASKLRMSDDERLNAIDRLYADMQEKRIFLQQFNEEIQLLFHQKRKEKAELKGMQQLFKPH